MSKPYDFRSTPLHTDTGVEWSYVATFEDDDGDPLDFTGWDWEMEGRVGHSVSPALFALGVGTGIVVGTSTVTPTISDTVLAAIPPGKYVWELRGSNASGDGEITIKGPWIHHPGAVI